MIHWPIGHGFGMMAGIFGAIVWAIGTFVLLVVVVVLIVLLARFLWFGTKASQRYLELNGSPTPRVKLSAPATSSTPASSTPTSSTPTSSAPATAPSKPRSPKPPAA